MNDAKISQLQAQVSALSEEIAVLKSQLSDERWNDVSAAIEQTNVNFQSVKERLDGLEQAVQRLTSG